MNQLRPIDSILVLAVVLLAVGQAYIIFGGERPDTVSGAPSDAPSRTEGVAAIPPSNVLTPVAGKVTTVSAEEIVVMNEAVVKRIGIAADTVFVRQGARKSDAVIAQDMEAFRQHSHELAQDPEKNHNALATLVAPSPFEETVVSLSDIRPGDFVSAFANSSGDATKVVVIR